MSTKRNAPALPGDGLVDDLLRPEVEESLRRYALPERGTGQALTLFSFGQGEQGGDEP